jgi:hypothetical protein
MTNDPGADPTGDPPDSEDVPWEFPNDIRNPVGQAEPKKTLESEPPSLEPRPEL